MISFAQLCQVSAASAQENDATSANAPNEPRQHHSVSFDVPRVAYTDTAFGVGALTMGAAGFGEARGSANANAQPHLGGGVRLWGSPIDRLVLVLDAERRDSNDKFAPAVTAQVRIFGSEQDGWALGLLGRYKTEGFASVEGEIESGILVSASRARFHLDANAVVGGDFDGKEGDGELLARGGYDVLPFLRLGFEGRGRYRLAGNTELPGNRVWDAFGGGQIFGFADHYFAAATGGPSTVRIVDRIGWSVIASAGGVMF
jgi:hypothetical protein